MAKEINLVPDIKNEFIQTLKFRNFVFFLCIVVAASSLIVMLIFLSIAGGQQGFINAKQNTIDALQKKITDYSDLSDFLTIRDQLKNINIITENKKMMSRTFNILSAIIPTGDDYINISELSVSLADESPTFNFEAQANAGTDPKIDYKVLDAFKKSMQYLRYDYGEYVDKNDQPIPAYCIVESNIDGSTFRDPERGYFAYWLIEGEGCNPSAEESEEEEEEEVEEDTLFKVERLTSDSELLKEATTIQEQPAPAQTIAEKTGYQTEEYNGQNVVRIWRTPQYVDWYKSNPSDDEPYMDLNGAIHNIPHFNSSCITYSGTEKENGAITWSTTNESCLLVPNNEDGSAGISIEDSSNGRNAAEELVLRFSAVITFAPEVFNFNNHHMLALPPAGRRNVTDSYAQIQSIFAERATDCAQNDTECITTPTSDTSSNSSDNNSNNNDNSNNDTTNPTTEEESREEQEELW
ncbi:hypothetical protein IKG07_02510 [Candidatus Saccharibacteria bacterium]|nr:hypothetical protein [Candidatus Saccharibacteria bacterium]